MTLRLVAVVCAVVLASWALAELPTPEQVGFHHCALIYERPRRNDADLLPYVCRVAAGKPRAWLFDAFLFLHFTARSGVRTDDGPTTRSDWQYQLDQWFAPGRDLHALDEAIERAARHLGKPPRPRMVLLTMPYPNPTVRDFGGGPDGVSPDLQGLDGVRQAARWYVAEAARRFSEAGFRHLSLWGIYWMREEMPSSDEERVRAVSEVVHAAGLRFAWIPWWRATGFDRWRGAGFDVAFMQPNYAFHSWTHGGSVRRNRLGAAADLARQHGLGVEMEAGDVVGSEADRMAFLHYLADGAKTRLDYQRSAMAYYLGTDTLERVSASPDARHRAVYDSLARFVAGQTVRDPGPGLALKRSGDTIIMRLSSAQFVSGLDVFLDEPARADAWTGQAEVQVRRTAREPWKPGGWAIRAGYDETSGRRQVMTIPIGRTCSEMRLTARGNGAKAFRATRIVPETLVEEAPIVHAARGCAYAVSPHASGIYDDDGTKLTDGLEPERGFSEGKSVGWMAAQVVVSVDLGAVRRFQRVEAACQGGSYAGVNWPADAVLMVADDRPPPASLAAEGAMPRGFRFIAGAAPAITRRRSDTDLDGVIAFELDRPSTARYLTLAFRPVGWLMLTELRILDGDVNVARNAGVRYRVRPRPTPAAEIAAQYADDGLRLTDGIVARGFNRRQVFGWDTDEPRCVELDLGRVVPVALVRVWTLAGGSAGIFAPSSVIVEVSSDGISWHRLGDAVHGPVAEDGAHVTALPWTVGPVTPASCRYVRATITRARGWAMVSEMEIHAPEGSDDP